MWTDGDIDIDQTCLIVRTVQGGLVAIPNAYVDEESQETLDQSGQKVLGQGQVASTVL